MPKPREPWNIRPAKKRASVTASLKAEVETKAKNSIDNVLKPKHVLPPPAGAQFNYITDIQAKWYRSYFYFFSIYACPGPNALAPSFESKFARMEPLGREDSLPRKGRNARKREGRFICSAKLEPGVRDLSA